jgi:type III secretory pathway component EscU
MDKKKEHILHLAAYTEVEIIENIELAEDGVQGVQE